jgi:nicotinamidase-related amidase
MKIALLIIDMQKAFFKGDCEKSMEKASEDINEAVKCFRENNLPVIIIQHKNENDNLIPGEEDFECIDILDISAEDLRIHKTYANAFNKTELDKKLKDLNVDMIIVTGFSAEDCVLSTCRGAMDFDYLPVILRDSLASPNAENITAVERITDIISIGALKTLLKKSSTFKVLLSELIFHTRNLLRSIQTG